MGNMSKCSRCPCCDAPEAGPTSAPNLSLLDIEPFDETPFSESFSGMFEYDGSDFGQPSKANPDISYDIEQITDMKEFGVGWDDEDIDEVLVISPKANRKLPTIMEDLMEVESPKIPKHAATLSNFDLLDGGLCRRQDTGEVYVLRRRKPASAVHAVMETINNLHAPFLQRMRWSFIEEECFYMILDSCPRSLIDYVTNEGKLNAHQALIFASEIVEGLSSLHAAGILHLNLNPENVMIDRDGQVMLTDLEYARFDSVKESVLKDSSSCSAKQYEYRSPESLLGWPLDSAVDCWAFGGLLYFMLLGMHPFGLSHDSCPTDVQKLVLHEVVLFPSTTSVDPVARDLISKCIERNPALRLNLQQIRGHEYFASVLWSGASTKDSSVVVSRRDRYSRQDLARSIHRISQVGPIPRPLSCKIFDDCSSLFSRNARDSIQANLPNIFRSSIMDVTGSNMEPILSILEQDAGFGLRTAQYSSLPDGQANSNLSPKERMALFWESLDQDLAQKSAVDSPLTDGTSASAISLFRPRKLRKQRSSLVSSQPQRFSLLPASATPRNLRKKLSAPNLNLLKRRASRPELLDLPKGIKQIGSGIGFTYALPVAAVSKASICSSAAPTNCHGGFPTLGLGLGILKPKIKRSGIYRLQETANVKRGSEDAFGSSVWSLTLAPGLASPATVNYESPVPASDTTANNSPLSDVGPLTPGVAAITVSEVGVTDSDHSFWGDARVQDVQDVDLNCSTLRLVIPSGNESGFDDV